jgi:hypothetical protein
LAADNFSTTREPLNKSLSALAYKRNGYLRRGFEGITGYVKKPQQKRGISLKAPKGGALKTLELVTTLCVELLEKVSD